jgi:hypothetical protein
MNEIKKLLVLGCVLGVTLMLGNVPYAQATDEEKEAATNPDANPPGYPPTQDCDGDPTQLLFPLDGTYYLVDFYGDGCTGSGCAQGTDQHNDDDSATVPLPFTYDLYGDLYTTAYVNNNGNLSFVTYYSTYTAEGFPSPNYIMVAPFWGDVDTGNPTNFIGDVWMRFFDGDGDSNDDTLVVTWDNVGYYNEHGDLRNTFQVAISDGTNPVMGIGNNVCFAWDNMCWTTGDASGGTGGFGGSPAIVGANRGNGVEYFQIGAFDHEGTDYDGPYGNNDGVSFLDYSVTCFNTGEFINIAPIPQGFPAGNQVTVDAGLGEVLDLDLQFISPEPGQTVTVVINDVDNAQGAGLVITNNSPQLEVVDITLDWTPDCGDVGSYALEFTATDDFNPPGQTDITLDINVLCTSIEACCLPDGSCIQMPDVDCLAQGGIPQGPGTVCTTPEACCFPDNTCAMVDPLCCDDLGGATQGAGTVCLGMQACCWPDGSCFMADATCCEFVGGEPKGPGIVCLGIEACCFPDGTCAMMDAICCENEGGEPKGPGTHCLGMQACCFPDDTCAMLDAICCENEGGVPMGPGSVCLGDSDGDGKDDLCAEPGEEAIPTVSHWGLIVLALLLLAVAKVYFGRRRATA